jgi:sn-glycerol 3-phosphate transport system ATP-binding protein
MNLIPQNGRDAGQILGVRPEHLSVVTAPTDTSWTVTVQTTELLGAERLIYAKYGDAPIVIRVDSDTRTPTIGETLHVIPRADQLHWFDATTEKRLP